MRDLLQRRKLPQIKCCGVDCLRFMEYAYASIIFAQMIILSSQIRTSKEPGERLDPASWT
jgi:hypothetical protein